MVKYESFLISLLSHSDVRERIENIGIKMSLLIMKYCPLHYYLILLHNLILSGYFPPVILNIPLQ